MRVVLPSNSLLVAPYPVFIWSHRLSKGDRTRMRNLLFHHAFDWARRAAAMMLSRPTCSLMLRCTALSLARPVHTSQASSLKTTWCRRLHNSSYAKSGSLDVSATPGQNSKTSGIQSHSKHAHAVLSTFDLFSIGVGPSSSHTGTSHGRHRESSQRGT